MARTFLACIIAICLGIAANAGESQPPVLRVPDGFTVERVAAEPDVVYPMFACFDDRGRLFVVESSGGDLYAELKAQTRKCRVKVLEDPDERGRFRKSSVFAEKLNFPMGLVWRDGKLYIADPPDLVTLEDADGDGKADKRTVILTGFGHIDNGSLHGLTFGPDGLLYMTMGRPDGYKIKRRDGSIVESKTGALLRCRPDGSDPEVISRGFENLVEVIFTPRGDIIGTNNWFQRPTGGIRDSLVHLVEGGLYPMHGDDGTPQPITGEFLPAVSLFPAVALSGLERYRGQAFSGMQGHLFSAQHNTRKVGRHVLIPHGSTFRSQDFDFVTAESPDFHPSDVLEDADGSLIVIDTGSWYTHHCPTGQIRKVKATGGIHRVRKKGAPLCAYPRGLNIDWSNAAVDDLVMLLADPRPVVRDRAQQMLTQRGQHAVFSLARAARTSKDLTARQHALWALAGIPGHASLEALRDLPVDTDVDLTITAARGLAMRRDGEAMDRLTKLLSHNDLAVRLAVVEALARCGDRPALPYLWEALVQPDVDHFLEHAIIHALFHLADTAELDAALRDPQPRKQQAALILLNQPPRPKNHLKPEQVIEHLRSSDENLRSAAVAILRKHPEWAKPSLALLRGWMELPKRSAEEDRGLRELTLAYQSAAEVQELLAHAIADAKTSAETRLLALASMGQSSLPKAPATWTKALELALASGTPKEVRFEAVRTVAVLQLPQLDDALANLAETPTEPMELRLEALRAIVLRRALLSPAHFQLTLDALRDENQPLHRLAAGEIIGRARLNDEQLDRALLALPGDAVISPSVVLPGLLRAAGPSTAAPVLKYLEESINKGWRPSEQELHQVSKRFPGDSQAAAIGKRVTQMAGALQERLTLYESELRKGDVQRGRAVFFDKKVACATCHRVGNEGGLIGPDLTKLGAIRAGRDILESIVVPSSTIAQGYDPYVFVTDDGKVLNGLLARQTADLVIIRDASGAELHLRKDQIQEMRRATVSLMPEGLDRALGREEFRDLLAYLQSLK